MGYTAKLKKRAKRISDLCASNDINDTSTLKQIRSRNSQNYLFETSIINTARDITSTARYRSKYRTNKSAKTVMREINTHYNAIKSNNKNNK